MRAWITIAQQNPSERNCMDISFSPVNPLAQEREEPARPTRRGAAAPRRSDDVEVFDTRRDVAVLRFLGVQLDVQAQIIDGVRVPERVLVADPAYLEQIEQ